MSKLREKAREVLDLYNYFNSAIIFDRNAVAVYYYNNRPDLILQTKKDVIGKRIDQIYPNLDLKKSSIMRALNAGEPTMDQLWIWKNAGGEDVKSINTTMPIIEKDEVIGAVEIGRFVGVEKLQGEGGITLAGPAASVRTLSTVDDIISGCPQINRLKDTIRKVSKTDSSVLIYGKTGTGKEMVAEAIHQGSRRRHERFAAINCAAIPGQLLENVLFGSVKGSFTGAVDRAGLFEAADGGTVLLDEINNMELSLQAKILKAIEEQRIMRVGSNEPQRINVRVLAASNQEPRELVQKGILREDLYYRLRVVQLDLPALAERDGDVALLTDWFISYFNRKMNRNIIGLDEKTEELFARHKWEGNVRELKNTIEGAFNLAEGRLITLRDISWYEPEEEEDDFFYGLHFDGTRSLKALVRDYEARVITDTMKQCENLRQTGERLGLTRQNLRHKLKACGIENKINIPE